MSSPPDIEAALAALEEEVGYKVRQGNLARTWKPWTGGSETQPFVRWSNLYEWCKAHPGVGVTLEGVYSNLPWKLRKRFPDLYIEGWNHHYDDTGRRVASMYVIYSGPDA